MPLLGTRGAASAKGFGFTANTKEVPTVIGQPFGGGYYIGLYSSTGNGVADYYLVVSPKAVGQSGLIALQSPTTSFTNSVSDGSANSASMNSASFPAVQFCKNLTAGGYTDWYLPSRYELAVAYQNLKPTTQLNRTAQQSGKNAYSVPPRTEFYTAEDPAQTSAALFQTGSSEFFIAVDQFGSGTFHWSSSSQSTNGWRQQFSDGYVAGYPKTGTNNERARAFRRVPI
jgi:hypothetical protein